MNILITSAGRRNNIVEYFKDVVHPLGGKVHTMNSDSNAASSLVSDYFTISPLVYSSEYENFLFDYCLNNNIGIVISLLDLELPILSRLKLRFSNHNIRILVGDEWLTSMANDKWETYNFLMKNGFNTKPCFKSVIDFLDFYKTRKMDFPVFVKPRWGMASLSVYKADSISELEFYYNLVQKEIRNSYLKYESQKDIENSIIIQSQLPGEEFGLDIINDLNGNYCNTIVKKKIAMRAGETDIAITVDIPQLKIIGKQLSQITKHPANLDADVFFDGKESYILEMNPRFGGNYPFSHEAGVDLPKAIVNWHLGKHVPPEILKEKIGFKSMKGIQLVNRINNQIQ